jgi:hypothetical protein
VIGALAGVFVQIIFPVVAIVAIGYLLGRHRPIDLGGVTTLSVSVLIPAIVFDSLTRAAVPRELLARLILHVGVQLLCIGLLTSAAARVLGWRGPSGAALLMAALFGNSGNIGLPLALFGFGQAGLAIAGSWFAVHAISVHTLGVFIAARARTGARAALARLVRLPILYAIVAGIVVNVSGWPPPAPVTKAIQLLAAGSLAVLLLLVGLHLPGLAPRPEAGGATLAAAIRLLAAPPIAWLTGRLLGLDGVALSVAVMQASMPTAVTAALWAMEFDTRPALVAAAVVLSTVASAFTLTLLLTVLTTRW